MIVERVRLTPGFPSPQKTGVDILAIDEVDDRSCEINIDNCICVCMCECQICCY